MPGQVPTESSIPNFLLKLWRLVEDEQFQNCIGWDETGYSFHVCEPYMFSKSVLPLYFKHSNLNSFIRQLNMYGFRKVTNFDKATLKQQNEMSPQQQTTQQQDTLEFQHPYFVRGHAEMLQYIKRKVAASSRVNGTTATNNNSGTELMDQSVAAGGPPPVINGGCVAYHSQSSVDSIQCAGLISGNRPSLREFDSGSTFSAYFVEDLRQMREKTASLDVQVAQLRKENHSLWNEIGSLRQNQSKQQSLVNNLIQILSSFAQGQQTQNKSRQTRGQLLAIEPGTVLDARLLNRNCSDNNDIDENLVTTLKISDVTHEYETKKDTPKLCSGGYDNIQYNSNSSLNGNSQSEKEDIMNGYSKIPSPDESRISMYSNVSVDNENAMETEWTNAELQTKNTFIDESSSCDYDVNNDVNKLRTSLTTASQRIRFDHETAAHLLDLAENSNKTARTGEDQYSMTGLRSSLLSAPPCMHTLTVGAPVAAASAFFQRQTSVPCYVSYATMPPASAVSQTPPVSAIAAQHRIGGGHLAPAPAADFRMATINDGPIMEQADNLNSCNNRRSSTPMNNFSCQMSVPIGAMGDLVPRTPASGAYRTTASVIADNGQKIDANADNSMLDTGDDFSSFILSHFDAAQQNASGAGVYSCNGNCENAASGYY